MGTTHVPPPILVQTTFMHVQHCNANCRNDLDVTCSNSSGGLIVQFQVANGKGGVDSVDRTVRAARSFVWVYVNFLIRIQEDFGLWSELPEKRMLTLECNLQTLVLYECIIMEALQSAENMIKWHSAFLGHVSLYRIIKMTFILTIFQIKGHIEIMWRLKFEVCIPASVKSR